MTDKTHARTDTVLGPGDFVTPTVQLVRPLAEGGMGRVWVADHIGLHTQVVVKLMSEEMLARPDGSERFAREAAAAAAIKSPHVVQVFDHGLTDGGIPYIVMELLEGQDLAGYLAEHGRMRPEEAVALVVQVGRALTKAHKAGVVHRDIKPDNIFLCDTRDAVDASDRTRTPETSGPFAAIDEDVEVFVKLLDFGTAMRHEPTVARTTVPGQIMGTPYYMSPEQSMGAELDERSDIWSLGVVVFEALTGRRPFDGASIGAIALAIHGVAPKLSALVPELPVAIDEWFERCCAQKPENRFATVRDASVAFVEAVTGVAPADQPTESVFFPPVMPRGSKTPGAGQAGSGERTPMRPVSRSMPPLRETLGESSGGRRTTTIAAGAVMLGAALAMVAIVVHRSPDEARESAASTMVAATVAPPAPSAPPPAPPTAVTGPAMDEAPKPAAMPSLASATPRPVVVAPRNARETRDTTEKKPRATTGAVAAQAKPGARPTKDAGAPGRGHEDDDLLRLQNAAPPKPDPATAPPAVPSPASTPATVPPGTTATTPPPALPTD